MEILNNVISFREFILAKTGSENTAKVYSSNLGSFLKHFENLPEPKAISADNIISYLAHINGLSSRCCAHSAIKLFYKYKCRHGESTKFRFIPYPVKPDTIPDHVTLDDFIEIMKVCKNIKHKVVVLLAFDCGLRVSEIINLRIVDINSKIMNINIRQGKGKKDRVLKLTTITLQVLREYFLEYKPVEYLFNGQFGGQYTIRSCQKLFTDLCVDAKVRHYKFHALRHGFAMALYESGGYSLETIRDILGHSSVETTKIYARKNNNIIQKTLSPVEILVSKLYPLRLVG